MKVDINSTLSEMIKIKSKINQDFVFIDVGNFPLDKELEKESTIKEFNTNLAIILQFVCKKEIKEEIIFPVIRKIDPLARSKDNKRRKK